MDTNGLMLPTYFHRIGVQMQQVRFPLFFVFQEVGFTVRYEWLSQYYWENLDEVRMFTTRWMYNYNHCRPNMALSGITPKQWLAMAA